MKLRSLLGRLGRGRNFFFLYGRHGGRLALSLWPQKGGVLVCEEGSTRQRFVPRHRLAHSLLGRAIEARRLYVDWLL